MEKLKKLKELAIMGVEEEYHELILSSQEYLELEQYIKKIEENK